MQTKLRITNKASVVNLPQKGIQRQLTQMLTMTNPKYVEAKKYGRYLGWLDKEIKLWDKKPNDIIIPRGFTRQVLDLLKRHGLKCKVEDHRRILDPIDFKFTGKLRNYQEQAVKNILIRHFGVLEASTGSGKTIIALDVIAKRQQPTLILVHTKELLHQWAERIESFLGMKPGLVGDSKQNIQPLTVAIVNSAKKHLDKLPQYFGQIIVDECHRTPSSMFTEVVQAFDCYYMLGLTATAYRNDGLTKLIYMYLGDRCHKVDSDLLRAQGAILAPEVIQRETDFYHTYKDDYHIMLSALTEDLNRNRLIANDVIKEVSNRPGTALVVSDRVTHCKVLANMLGDLVPPEKGLKVMLLTGQIPKTERERIIQEVQAGKVDVLISTVQLLGEGFDCAGLSSLFLATPISFKGRLLQVVGRILRPADNKKPRVYDYKDRKVTLLRCQAKNRQRALHEIEAK